MRAWVLPASLVISLSASLLLLWPTQPLADDTDQEIRETILMQIEAFANNEPEAAWAFASEGIKRRFGSSDVFIDMVRQAYPAVHQATAIEFDERVPHGTFEIQVVKLQGPDGKRWDAYYRMVSVDGSWKVAGVQLYPSEVGI
ncbi:DUF4864 domain-containing protein [Marinobacter salinus]|uniref:DUF4864 domain-containing protein n=1 Tax=Marinobacter salinus TaxID=1874317 RepID=A0A1D9GS18_9GAMM|nr:DUF4864 domain-containing protein [Marinobacter salinus]